MKLYRNILFSLACAAGVTAVSCNTDATKPEGSATPSSETVSLKSTDNNQVFNLTHDNDGVHGTVEFSITANLSKPVDEDVTVRLSATCQGITTGKITLDPAEVQIKAGTSESSSVKVSISDWSELEGTEAEGTYSVSVRISGVSGAENVSAAAGAITATVKKEAKDKGDQPVTPPEPGEVTIESCQTSIPSGYTSNSADNINYTFRFYTKNGANVENAEENTCNGKGSGDCACDNDLLCFDVDFGEVKSFSGLYFRHWGNSFRPDNIELFYSDNGTEWKAIGSTEPSSASVYVMFSDVLSTRYIRYEMLSIVGSRVDIAAFGLIIAN